MSAAQSRRVGPRTLRTDPEFGTSPSAQIGSDFDKALALFRKAMPGFGLKLVAAPPLADGRVGRLCLSAWRRGEQSAEVHVGTSAREAVERLFDSEIRADRERRERTRCLYCGGIGWYITADAVRAICTHPSADAG